MKRIALTLFAIVLLAFSLFSQNPNKNETASSESIVIDTVVHSIALENNFLGDSPDRNVMIYLPPGYDQSLDKYYPVLYFLHSYDVDHTAFFGGFPWYNIDFKAICDNLITSGKIDPMIIVSPNSHNKYGGSFYTNSFVTGNWADFITEDLIDYMDDSFRTLPQKESRGLAGHSMGGYGAMWLVMNNPGVFNAVYSLSGQLENEELNLINGRETMIEAVNADSLEGLHWLTVVRIAQAAAVAPDTLAPPFYGQFPLDSTGEFIDSIWQKWLLYDPLYMLPAYKDSLLQLKAIQFDVGKYDTYSGFINGNRKFSQALSDLSIDHVFEEYSGDHSNRLAQRIEKKLLPFFSANLSKNMLDDTVPIPDTAFLHALIEEGVDTNGDSLISYAEAEAVTNLNVASYWPQSGNIIDMTGIEAFVNLEYLGCEGNQLTSLDVSKNTELEALSCANNQLTSLDVTNNIHLRWAPLNAGLDCSNNQLTSLDVSNKTALISMDCYGNQLTGLDLSNNTALIYLKIGDMPTLSVVCVWTMPFPLSGVDVDTTGSPNIYFTTECTIGLEELESDKLNIYPIPTNNLLTIEIEYPNHYSINITTLNGQQILTEEMKGTSRQIDLSSFSKGVYFITIRSDDFVTTRKIIKL